MLTPRQTEVLALIIQLYSRYHEPIGSKTLLNESYLEVSPATIRNDMATLEKAGLLSKAHTSSGRIPSTSGYRYYVAGLIEGQDSEVAREGSEEDQAFNEIFSIKQGDAYQQAQMAADLLVDSSHYTAFVFAQGQDSHSVEKFKFVSLDNHRVIGIILTDKGKVDNYIFQMPSDLSGQALADLADLLNSELKGLILEDAYQRLRFSIPLLTQRVIGYQFDFSALLEKSIHQLKNHAYWVTGKNNLFDLMDQEVRSQDLRYIFELVDGSKLLFDRLESLEAGIDIIFGLDLGPSIQSDLSIVTGTYIKDYRKVTIGLIGPSTMRYTRVIPLMQAMTKQLANT
ncbi:heat-inducible transcriptional repressor HrcA [Hutsoniella sourekii]